MTTVWSQTSNIGRSDAVARLRRGADERAEAWAALEAALDVLDQTPEPDWNDVPADFQEHWSLFVEDLARELPTLDQASPARFRDLMVERRYPPDLVAQSDATRNAFVHTVAERMAHDAARWLAGPDSDADDATRRRIARLADDHRRALSSALAKDLWSLSQDPAASPPGGGAPGR